MIVAGRGKVGTSLARALDAELVAGRDLDLRRPAAAVLVMLAVPDPAIAALAERLPKDPPAGSAAVHVGGGLRLAALAAAQAAGWDAGAFHPLLPFAAPQPPSAFSGATFAIDASTPELLATLTALAQRLGGRVRHVTDDQRPLYHAAAVLGSNYVVALVSAAAATLEQIGWSRAEAVESLLPLLRGAVDSLQEHGLPAALTGPVSRGDAETVRAHVRALSSSARARVYRILGLAALELAREAGLSQEQAEQIQEALTG